jgi:CDP-diglyceride synthetase
MGLSVLTWVIAGLLLWILVAVPLYGYLYRRKTWDAEEAALIASFWPFTVPCYLFYVFVTFLGELGESLFEEKNQSNNRKRADW